jgi:hypothetical protein
LNDHEGENKLKRKGCKCKMSMRVKRGEKGKAVIVQ